MVSYTERLYRFKGSQKPKVLLLMVYNDNMYEIEEIGICFIASVLRENGYTVMLYQTHEDKVDYSKIVDFNPNILGATVYDVSRESTYKVCKNTRDSLNDIVCVVGGITPTYMANKMLIENSWIDFAIRGEGENAMLELLESLSKGSDYNTDFGDLM